MICDTSALLAALWSDQPESEQCTRILKDAPLAVLSPFVLAEFDFLVANATSTQKASKAVRHLTESGFELAEFGWSDVRSALEVCETYSDLGLGLTDASLVVLAKRYKTNEILTLDQTRFRAIRGLDGRHLQLLPFDTD